MKKLMLVLLVFMLPGMAFAGTWARAHMTVSPTRTPSMTPTMTPTPAPTATLTPVK